MFFLCATEWQVKRSHLGELAFDSQDAVAAKIKRGLWARLISFNMNRQAFVSALNIILQN
jgi:hypothetical protein